MFERGDHSYIELIDLLFKSIGYIGKKTFTILREEGKQHLEFSQRFAAFCATAIASLKQQVKESKASINLQANGLSSNRG